jgi:hypothetical protein
MRVHTLDTRDDWQRDITHLEIHLARLFPPVANDGPGENAS